MKAVNYISLFLFLALCSLTSAKVTASSDFFYLDWQKMPLDSVCPSYTEVVPLESDYRTHTYHVSLLFPEWQEMSENDVVKMQQWKDSITDELTIATHVGVSRGQGMLDICFIPVVLRDGKFLKLMSAKMQIDAVEHPLPAKRINRTSASTANRYTYSSKLSKGRWVKISITEDGMYQLTRAQLTEMGFANPQNVHLYGYGGHRESEVSAPDNEFDDIEEVPLYQADNDRWLFWGNGLVHWESGTRIFNPYANEACYFLHDEDSVSSITTTSAETTTTTNVVTTFTDYVLYEKDDYAYFHGGRNLFDAVKYSKSSKTYTLTTPSTDQGNEKLTVVFTGAESNTVVPTVNGTSLASISLSSPQEYNYGVSSSKTYDVSKYKSGSTWTIKLTTTTSNEAHLDYLQLAYTRSINPEGSYVAFSNNKTGSATFGISGFADGYKVMQIGSPGQPATLLSGTKTDSQYLVKVSDGSQRFVCFNPAATFPEPFVVGDIENQNLHALDSLDMVIIIPTSGKLLGQAERLAELHRAYDGLRVGIVRADQVYNEFSSGTPDATAYRRLMKMLYDRANGDYKNTPSYLLLMGSCAWDNRMLTSTWTKYSPDDYLLCFESENSFSDTRSYMMEDYFGLLDDGEGSSLLRDKTDLGVGRFPVTSAADAKIMVDKVENYITNKNAGAWKNVVLMLGDDGDSNSHMQYANTVAENIINDNPELEVRKIMWDAYTRVSTTSANTYPEVVSAIKSNLNEGVLMVNYTGHGATYVLSHEKVWGLSDFQNFKSNTLPLWFTAACDVMPLDKQVTNLGETAVLTEGGGALAFVGTTRTVYASNNAAMNESFSHYLFATDDDSHRYRLGDALRLAKVFLADDEKSNRENKLQYVLAGDPALTMGEPLNRVVLDSIVNSSTGKPTDELKAGMPVRLVGHLVDDYDEPLTRFNGILNARVYDTLDSVICKKNDASITYAFRFANRTSILFSGRDSVRAGKFSLSFVVPKDIKYKNDTGRMVFYAINDSLNIEANGYDESFAVGGAVETSDTIGPKMEIWLNGEAGGTVNSTPYLTARLSDESGINNSGNGVGHDILLTIDNNPDLTYVLNDYYVADFGDYTQGSLAYSIPALTEGAHTLTLRAWDMLNNTSTQQMDFNVDLSYKPSILNLSASPNPATASGTTFFITSDLPGSDCDYTLEVFDFAGRRLWMYDGSGASSTGQYAVQWNLSVGAGNGRVGPGIYLYRATLTSGDSKKVSKTQKLIVNWSGW